MYSLLRHLYVISLQILTLSCCGLCHSALSHPLRICLHILLFYFKILLFISFEFFAESSFNFHDWTKKLCLWLFLHAMKLRTWHFVAATCKIFLTWQRDHKLHLICLGSKMNFFSFVIQGTSKSPAFGRSLKSFWFIFILPSTQCIFSWTAYFNKMKNIENNYEKGHFKLSGIISQFFSYQKACCHWGVTNEIV